MRLLLIFLILSLLAAACDSTAMPTLPPITVVVTAVENTAALNDAVAMALTGTQQSYVRATETVLAQGGVTLTPSSTPTLTPTPPLRATRETTPTPTLTPTVTLTPTYAPYMTNTPDTVSADLPGWVRVVHAWIGSSQTPSAAFDVFINGDAVRRGLEIGEQSQFQRVAPGAVQVALQAANPASGLADASAPPAYTSVVQVAPGETVSLVLTDTSQGVKLVPVHENAAPLGSGFSRVTVVQANPRLTPFNLVLQNLQRALAIDFKFDQVVGPVDIPSGGNYLIDLYDVTDQTALLGSLPLISFANRVSYLLVLVPSVTQTISDVMVFSGTTRTLASEVHARFVNASQRFGPVRVQIDGQIFFDPLPIGISESVPLSVLGSRVEIESVNSGAAVATGLEAWTTEEERNSEKIVVLFDLPPDAPNPINMQAFSQTAPRSAINGEIRLIHALAGVIPVNLELRPIRTLQSAAPATVLPGAQAAETENVFVRIAEADFGSASAYAPRSPGVYDARVVLSGTRNIIAEMNSIQVIAGGIYDFVVLPGEEVGSAELILVQPVAQTAADRGNPAAVSEAVAATLTAIAPVTTATPTRESSPTPTRTPLPTNTPRPTNTPDFPPPSLVVDPAPPNTAVGSVVLVGFNFPAGRTFGVFIDDMFGALQTGVVAADGTLLVVVSLPETLTPGLHTIRVCAAGTCPGTGSEAFAIVNVASPRLTPSPTASP